MQILRSFSKSEDAHLLTTLLLDHDIDATVIDDSAYGGNLLGAIKNSIRIEVPNDQYAAAREVMEAAATSNTHSAPEDEDLDHDSDSK